MPYQLKTKNETHLHHNGTLEGAMLAADVISSLIHVPVDVYYVHYMGSATGKHPGRTTARALSAVRSWRRKHKVQEG